MTGHRSFSGLRRCMSPERLAANADAAQSMLQDIDRRQLALHELRQARQRSQEELARVLKVQQPAIAKLEHRADMHVSNLRRYVQALGGTLEITARFPEGEVTITNFRDVGPAPDRPAATPPQSDVIIPVQSNRVNLDDLAFSPPPL